MSTNIKFKAEEKLVGEILFGSFYKFRIPRYQRPYAWGIDQISDFWNDLISEDDFVFIGNFIFNNEPLSRTGYIDIIDGQQRILSITIFIAVLRDMLDKIDAESAKRYQRQDISIEDREINFEVNGKQQQLISKISKKIPTNNHTGPTALQRSVGINSTTIAKPILNNQKIACLLKK